FQAEDGIRDRNVTGVQTCALPISRGPDPRRRVLHDPPRQGVLVRGLVLHRHRRRPGADRAVHARGAPRRPAVGRLPAMAARGVVLEVDSVSKSFGALAALSRVGFAVSEGQVFSVIGPNGAGKSTLFNVVPGLYAPSAG